VGFLHSFPPGGHYTFGVKRTHPLPVAAATFRGIARTSPRVPIGLPRRRFLARAGAAAVAAISSAPFLGAAASATLRAAIIGQTGGGDYGHGYDRILSEIEGVEVVAVADPDSVGREQAIARSGARRGYGDFREMLARERPDLVSIAFRHPRSHTAVALAAIEAGAHLFIEKPLTETLPEADRVVAAAKQKGTHTVVAHNRRYGADFQKVRALLKEGFLGRVREAHFHGKQDHRAGGEDLLVLGTHDFDLMRWLFGDPQWCSATVLVGGRHASRADARDGREPIRVMGDTVRAQFGFAENVAATWESVSAKDAWNQPPGPREHWSFEILGTRRVLAYQSGVGFAFLDSPYLLHPANDLKWQPLPTPAGETVPAHHTHMGRDLVHGVRTGESALCSAQDGAWAIEMVTAVYQAHLNQRRVSFPLADRTDPLA
jgi:predicted dehydrogenase